MKSMEVASRYAGALFAVAKENGEEKEVYVHLKALADLCAANAELARFVTSPIVTAAEKEKVFSSLISAQKINPTVKSAMSVLAQKDRIGLVGEVTKAYAMKMDSASGITRGEVRSGGELTNAQKQEVEKKISAAIGRDVVLSYLVDEKLHGGLLAKVGSFQFDDSLLSHLHRIQEDLNRREH